MQAREAGGDFGVVAIVDHHHGQPELSQPRNDRGQTIGMAIGRDHRAEPVGSGLVQSGVPYR